MISEIDTSSVVDETESAKYDTDLVANLPLSPTVKTF